MEKCRKETPGRVSQMCWNLKHGKYLNCFVNKTQTKINKWIDNQLTLFLHRSLSNDSNKDPTYKWERIRWEDKKQFPESSRRAWRWGYVCNTTKTLYFYLTQSPKNISHLINVEHISLGKISKCVVLLLGLGSVNKLTGPPPTDLILQLFLLCQSHMDQLWIHSLWETTPEWLNIYGEISSDLDRTKKMMENLNIIRISHLTVDCSWLMVPYDISITGPA